MWFEIKQILPSHGMMHTKIRSKVPPVNYLSATMNRITTANYVHLNILSASYLGFPDLWRNGEPNGIFEVDSNIACLFIPYLVSRSVSPVSPVCPVPRPHWTFLYCILYTLLHGGYATYIFLWSSYAIWKIEGCSQVGVANTRQKREKRSGDINRYYLPPRWMIYPDCESPMLICSTEYSVPVAFLLTFNI